MYSAIYGPCASVYNTIYGEKSNVYNVVYRESEQDNVAFWFQFTYRNFEPPPSCWIPTELMTARAMTAQRVLPTFAIMSFDACTSELYRKAG